MKALLKNNILSIVFLLAAIMAIVVAFYSFSSLNEASDYLEINIARRLESTCILASNFVDSDELDLYKTPDDMLKPEYNELKNRLDAFAKEHDLIYIYYYRAGDIDSNGKIINAQAIIDNDFDPKTTYSLDTDLIEMEEIVELAFKGETVSTELGYYSEEYLGLLSAFSPVYDSNGDIVAVVGIDITDEHIFKIQKRLSVNSILLTISVILVFLSGGVTIAVHLIKEHSLKANVSRLELVESISTKFLASSDNLKTIEETLETLGLFLKASRVLFFYNNPDAQTTLIWRHGNETSNVDIALKTIIFEKFEHSLENGDSSAIIIDDINKDAEFQKLLPDGVKSIVSKPLHIGNKLKATLIVEKHLELHKWTKEEIQLIELVGNLYTEGLNNKETNDRLVMLSAIVENSPQVICHLDRNGMLSYINRASITQFGYNPTDLANKGMQKLFGQELKDEIFNKHLADIREKGNSEYILPYKQKSGDSRILHAYAFSISKNGQNGIGVIGIDITDNIRIDKERIEALKEAKRSSQAKSDFLANMSHEMRTPMNAIIGMTSIGLSAMDIDRKNYCLNKINDASIHLLGVINDILDMSKIEANKLELTSVEFEFEKTLQKVVNVVNFRVDEKNQKFTVNLDKWIPHSLIGDDQRLVQVITNLLSNAIKFTPDGGNIHLNTKLVNEYNGRCEIKIDVTDTGIGISDEQQSQLFHSFSQADSGISRKFGGTGLGLTISKRIIEMMGGNIQIKSELGKGSTFSFNVFMKRGVNAPAKLLRSDINWSNIRILAVDDAPDILEYFEDIAKRLGVYCDLASNGINALTKISENGAYDIYFIDWRMPEMNGIELSRRIKSTISERAVVIMISSIEWGTIAEEARNAGVDMFIPKPLFPSAIANCINECIGLKNIVEEENAKVNSEHDCFDGFTLLLVEDVEINREIVIALLEPTSIAIDCAENGEQAVDMYLKQPDKYDIIFMDIQMPEMDGYEATGLIRKSNTKSSKDIPIIAMTANVFKEDVEKCIVAGMDAHVGKPLDFEEVLETLRKYLVVKK
ncbi:MAG: response regulator [Christensenellaceae bacterium]|jgi:PAS domain S-box-containing protein|nr:response regulator [Christensenellaceae bacterium]